MMNEEKIRRRLIWSEKEQIQLQVQEQKLTSSGVTYVQWIKNKAVCYSDKFTK